MAHQNGKQIENRLNGHLLSLAKIYRITTTSGDVLRFSDHDKPIYFDDYFFEPDLNITLLDSGVVDFANSGSKITIDTTSSVGTFTQRPPIGSTITVAGAVDSANNGDHVVTSVTSTNHELTCTGSTIADESNDSGVTITMKAVQGNNVKIYSPEKSWDISNVRHESGLKEASVDLVGAITSDKITDNDIKSGKYVNAIVDIAWVDWRMPHLGAIRVNRFKLDTFKYDDYKWVAQARNKVGDLHVKAGKVFSKRCWHSFTSSDCGIKKELGVTFMRGKITEVISQTDIRWETQSGAGTGVSEVNDYFRHGHLIFESGATNSGVTMPIKQSYTRTGTSGGASDDARIVFPYPPKLTMTTDDYFTVYAGCDKTVTSCASTTLAGKINNILNFGGFPQLPSSSVLLNENENDGF